MNDKELARRLRTIAVDLDLSGRTSEWQTVAEAAVRLDELEATRTYVDLTQRLSFWERWTMEWRTTAAIVNRQLEIGTDEAIRRGIALYIATREGYTKELRQLHQMDNQ